MQRMLKAKKSFAKKHFYVTKKMRKWIKIRKKKDEENYFQEEYCYGNKTVTG